MTTSVSQKHRVPRALGLTGALVLVGLAACDAADKTTGVTASSAQAGTAVGQVEVHFVTGALTDSTSSDQITFADSTGRVIGAGHLRLVVATAQTAGGHIESDGEGVITVSR
jgi:hypothetical protein